MTDVNTAAFPQPKPTIVEILIEGFTTDQTGVAMLKQIAEHYPTVTQEDFDAAMADAQDPLAGRQERQCHMTSIDAVTITAWHTQYTSSGPDLTSLAFLRTEPGHIYVGTWGAGILSLDLPDGDRRRAPCSDADEAVREATLTWNTAEGFVTLERWIAQRGALQRQQWHEIIAANNWTGDRRHEWQEPKQLVILARATIKQAVKDGVLPMPDDYRVTWQKDEETICTICVDTYHMMTGRDMTVHNTVWAVLDQFNASRAEDRDGQSFGGQDFSVEIYAPPAKTINELLAAMERTGFPAADIDDAREFCSCHTPDAE